MPRMRIPEVVVPGKRLGRHLEHDPRSLAYVVPEGKPQTTTWKRIAPILDQGNLGSCVGNAMTGLLGSDVLYDTVPKSISLDEAFAVKLYSLATQLDEYPGQYPPDDSGSSGLGGAKAVKQDNLASGYTHATSLAGCWTMIAAGPFAVGFSWYSGMDNPTSEGVVSATGTVRGGHEFEVLNYDAGKGLWECVNSWGDGWGKGGHFFIPDADFARLLAEQGDATQLAPVTQPAPTPTPPQPTPTPTPPAPQPTDQAYVAWLAGVDAVYQSWRSHPIRDRRKLEGAIEAWKKTVD